MSSRGPSATRTTYAGDPDALRRTIGVRDVGAEGLRIHRRARQAISATRERRPLSPAVARCLHHGECEPVRAAGLPVGHALYVRDRPEGLRRGALVAAEFTCVPGRPAMTRND